MGLFAVRRMVSCSCHKNRIQVGMGRHALSIHVALLQLFRSPSARLGVLVSPGLFHQSLHNSCEAPEVVCWGY